jgi:hypothetical protein
MAEPIKTGLKLLRLLVLCWSRPVITLDDIKTVCQHDEPLGTTGITTETAYNYLNTLEALGVTLEKRGHYWVITETPAFAPLRHLPHWQTLYPVIRSHPGTENMLALFDRLMGQPKPHCTLTPTLIEAWDNAVAQQHPCDLQTTRRWMPIVPLQAITQAAQRNVLVWHLDFELPLRVEFEQIVQLVPWATPHPPVHPKSHVPVVFDVSGPLLKRFEPTLQDTVISKQPQYWRIAHHCTNATALCRRLLRYQTHCQVVSPLGLKHLLLDEVEWLMHGTLMTR